MAESCCSSSEAFSRALSFSLVQLGLPNVVLKEESGVLSRPSTKDEMCLSACPQAMARVCVTKHYPSLDPRPSDLCILMEGLVRDDHVA